MVTKKQKFTIHQFLKKYNTEEVCLEEVFRARYGKEIKCKQCGKKAKYYRVRGRKCYACEYCGHQLHPLAGTIFHKSSTSLKSWFFALYLFASSRNGVSAKELERQLGVTYKCAWRMAKQIRLLFLQPNNPLKGIVEADESYIGGKRRGKRGRGPENKTPVVGMAQRKGSVRAKVTVNTKSSTVMPIIRKNVRIGSNVVTDTYPSYNKMSKSGYFHRRINHSKGYVKGDIHTNTVEGFWSILKRSVEGTYCSVSPKFLQSYVNEFAYRYNLRFSDVHLFDYMFAQAVRPA